MRHITDSQLRLCL